MKSAPKKAQGLIISELPSRFLPYSVSYLEARSFTFDEMLYLTSSKLPEEAIAELYSQVLTNIDVFDELSYSDFLFVVTNISLFTKPNQRWRWKIPCPKCSHINIVEKSGKNFWTFEDLELPDYPIIAENLGGKDLQFGVLTVRNALKFKKLLANGEIKPHQKRIASAALTVLNMEYEEAFNHLKKLSVEEDILLLTEIDEILYHGVKAEKFTCTSEKCNNTFSKKVGLEVPILIPFRDVESSIKSRIRYGNQS